MSSLIPRPSQQTWLTTVLADPATAAQVRDHLGQWLDRTVCLDPQRRADIVLACDEALSNCVDHAYRRGDTPGAMTMHIRHDSADQTLDIQVTDHGRWADPQPSANPLSRGRGMLLMRALADEVSIDGTDHGTTVHMLFHDCPIYTAA